ncbi:MAG TPA: dihydroorotate dehydrogenase electron transfer subunit [Myxococcota bacterium]|nr:dihydroorotate dehydrogenase electron transfer subunit [Myxococcota bacterium]
MGALQLQAELTSVHEAARSTFLLELAAPRIAELAQPGQFVMLGPLLPDSQDPFLSRPFSIHGRTRDGLLQLLVGIVGRGTGLLAGMRPGDRIHVLGPLGNGFDMSPGAGPLVAVGGGLGIAPLLFLAKEYTRAGGEAVLLYGAGSADLLVDVDKLRSSGVRVALATDDGTSGRPGTAADLLVQEHVNEPARLAACGPWAMLETVADIARRRQLDLQVSLESHMACGVGACLGCTVFLDSGVAKRVCKEGPVFDYREVFGR